MQKPLSKSVLLRGFQCEKNLYLHRKSPQLETKPDASQLATFEQGSQVGRVARTLFPGGVLIDAKPWENAQALALTREAIQSGKNILFEAAFEFGGVFARVDILKRESASSPWHLIEVKSATKVKEENLTDVAIQRWILSQLEMPVEKTFVMHLNTEFRHPDQGELFKSIDVTEQISSKVELLPTHLERFNEMLQSPTPPPTDIGQHCQSPYTCGFSAHCWKEKQIPKLSVLDIPRLGPKKWELYKKGILNLDDPRLLEQEVITATEFKELQLRMIRSTLSGSRWIDAKSILNEVQNWKYPFSYLDFETINPAIPRFNGAGPYQHVPFQLSLHIEQSDGSITHHEYLHPDSSDPREGVAKALIEFVPDEGSVIAYYHHFEAARLEELADTFPQYAEKLRAIRARLVDPLPLFQSFVYDPAFAGSFSIKKVAPAILGNSLSYENLAVGDGMAAQRAFEEMIAERTSPPKKNAIREHLLQYCKQDTLAMVDLVHWLQAARGTETRYS